ncbi:MAG: S-methyl-5'-thioadenosine phosphorylase [Candidatus Heimdallarchaeota archaeon]|nr:S-methyl-5'-thioadenosine phosphorylase [Candidatus Heimdallarchaeota archaeon]
MIGIIGGSGFYKPDNDSQKKTINTPFGDASVHLTQLGNKEVAFITRHKVGHSIPPHLVNYRANIYALHHLGVSRIITTSAVGSLNKDIAPGNFVVPDQFIDFTIGRPKTFFDGKFETTLYSSEKRSGVIHVDLTNPYCPDIRKVIATTGKKLKMDIQEKGVYVCTEGPRFETPAEINSFRILGGTLVGMTSASECILARELGMCYSTICLVTNFAAGMQDKISVSEVFKVFDEKIVDLRKLIGKTLEQITYVSNKCDC